MKNPEDNASKILFLKISALSASARVQITIIGRITLNMSVSKNPGTVLKQ
jgi:hypothetical protein